MKFSTGAAGMRLLYQLFFEISKRAAIHRIEKMP
jgi:hypothetical protein